MLTEIPLDQLNTWENESYIPDYIYKLIDTFGGGSYHQSHTSHDMEKDLMRPPTSLKRYTPEEFLAVYGPNAGQ
jgi:hypothetical protein